MPVTEPPITQSEWEALVSGANQYGTDPEGNPWTVASMSAAVPSDTNGRRKALRAWALLVLAS